MDVRQLVKQAKKGNKEALLQLIMNQKDDYYRLAYTYMGNEHDSMDAMEDMIVKVYEKIDQLKNDEAFYSWSKTILVNSCKTLLRKGNKIILMEELEHEETVNPYPNSDQQMEINHLLTKINETQAEAIKLKYLLDMDYQTIAQLTNVSIGTVKSRIFQGLKKLKDLYGGGN
ncbi:RNA polymerase sigma factor [Anaerobacillus alkaliphilus]|uniref:RNA polymerase sigma factor n=1 Tax=Anaerobacillus alkaliphilus TaxID=1548597 RepID=A0A4Q0VVA4_9BACI|nr:RNA polymerase sigma factor [Anaerobacillus alkaliphilus]RXJ02432.1 RNA polymerase sigma factor [Anaerobacillus alkaliphilus]